MDRSHIIGRTGHVKALKSMLEESRIIYLTSFFYSGKTVLLDQLARRYPGKTLRYNVGEDDWDAFAAAARRMSDGVLMIDGLNSLDETMADGLASMLTNLAEGQRAVLAGRAQMPLGLHALCASGMIRVLGREFVLFDEEEIHELYLTYDIAVKAADVTYLKNVCAGWPIMLHVIARKLQQDPFRPVRDMFDEVAKELWDLLIRDVVMSFPEEERILLFSLSPFQSFTEDMARMITGRQDAPAMMNEIALKSYMLVREKDGRFGFIPFGRDALFHEMRNHYSKSYIDGQYKRAALYYELNGQVPEAIETYMALGDTEKIRELLIRDTRHRPSNGDYVRLRPAYAMLSEDVLKRSPELMKGMCLIESLSCHVAQSDRWYEELRRFVRATPPRDAKRRTAQEALAYLDIALPHRGTGKMLRLLISSAKENLFTQSDSWRTGFNIAGNSISLMNGGKDFSRWAPHGWRLYHLFKAPIEGALGSGGSGIGDIAIAECELETNLTGDYDLALKKVCQGLSSVCDDVEMQTAAIGIQSRIMASRGDLQGAIDLIQNWLDALGAEAPEHMRENLEVCRLTYRLMQGELAEPLDWMNMSAPDELKGFVILDRYRFMLKLKLYIIQSKWTKVGLLISQLENYVENYDRPYMCIQLHLLRAIIDRRMERESWQIEMGKALDLARRYRLARVIADEGIAVLDMLSEMDLPEEPWEQGVIRLTREQAARYPFYLKSMIERPEMTDREYQVYSLMLSGCSNARIGKLLNLTERTVKHYLTMIYRKIGVKSRNEAQALYAEKGETL